MSVNREERGRRMLAGIMHSETGSEQRIIIKDISAHGIGARATGSPPSVEDRISIYLSQGRVLKGVVRWVSGNRFGVLLDGEIDPTSFQGSGGSWDVAEQKLPPGHVYDQFRPVSRGYRPGLKVR